MRGIVWEKPKLDIQTDTNIVSTGDRESAIVWLDHEEPDPARRYKLFRGHREEVDGRGTWYFQIHVSPDGIHWGEVVARSGGIYPRSTVFRKSSRVGAKRSGYSAPFAEGTPIQRWHGGLAWMASKCQAQG